MGICAAKAPGPGSGALPNETELVRKAAIAMGTEKELNAGIKLLLLGAGGSGKTTFRKQLRSIYAGFPEAERVEAAAVIVDNFWEAIKVIRTEALERKLDEITDPQSPVGAAMQRLAEPKPSSNFLTPKEVEDLNLVWSHPLVMEMVKERQKFHLQECALIYFAQLASYPAWGGEGWLPSIDDCIRARVRSSGVVEETILIDGVKFMLFDAGGQRSERRKWIHYFDRVNAIMFVTSLTAYAENLYEDSTQNNMVESLALFENLANSKWFQSTPILLFFNKRDVFQTVFVDQKIPLNVSGYFTEAPDSKDPDVAVRYIVDLYLGRKRLNPDRPGESLANLIYPHVTTAVDRDNIQKVFGALFFLKLNLLLLLLLLLRCSKRKVDLPKHITDTCKTIILKQALQITGFSY